MVHHVPRLSSFSPATAVFFGNGDYLKMPCRSHKTDPQAEEKMLIMVR